MIKRISLKPTPIDLKSFDTEKIWAGTYVELVRSAILDKLKPMADRVKTLTF
jgi:hypothetical protein